MLGGQRRHQRGCLCCCCMRLLWLCECFPLLSQQVLTGNPPLPSTCHPCRSLAVRAPLPLLLPPAPPPLHPPPLRPAPPRRPPLCPSLRRPPLLPLLPAPVPPPLPPPLLSLCPAPQRASERLRRLPAAGASVQPCRLPSTPRRPALHQHYPTRGTLPQLVTVVVSAPSPASPYHAALTICCAPLQPPAARRPELFA